MLALCHDGGGCTGVTAPLTQFWPSGGAVGPNLSGQWGGQPCSSSPLPWGWLLHLGSLPGLTPLPATHVPSQRSGVTLHLGRQGWKMGAECGTDLVDKGLRPAAAAGLAPQGLNVHTGRGAFLEAPLLPGILVFGPSRYFCKENIVLERELDFTQTLPHLIIKQYTVLKWLKLFHGSCFWMENWVFS